MNPPKIDRAIDALRERFSGKTGLRSAILFGSSARGTAREDSDIDVLLLVSGARIEKLRKEIHDIESAFDVNVSPMILEAREFRRLDRQFLDSVLRDGVPLAGETPAVSVQDLRLRPIRIVSFDVSHLPPSEKMRLYRALDGYATVKRRGRKRYERRVTGFLDEVGGQRVGRGAVVVPESGVPRLEELLSSVGAKRWTVAAWSQAP